MITRQELSNIAGNGVWKQNTSIVQILGLCPLLAVTTNAVNGIMLSLATIVVMAMSNVSRRSARRWTFRFRRTSSGPCSMPMAAMAGPWRNSWAK